MCCLGNKMILASGSPRRKELLEKMGLDFEVLVTDVNEDLEEGRPPMEAVMTLAKRKALEAVKIYKPNTRMNRIVIAADTIVYKDGKILGKPKDEEEAFAILSMLSGDWHSVYTGMAVAFLDIETYEEEFRDHVEFVQDVCHTRVRFKKLSDQEIKDYVNTGEPFDKAGAYGIQGRGGALVERIEGDYENVVGLPTKRLYKILMNKE